MRFRWFGSEFTQALRREAILKLSLCAEVLAGQARKLIRVPYKGARRDAKGRFTGGSYAQASAPGEPPRTRRFQQGLLGSVFWDINRSRLTARVGTPMRHGRYLELGTRRMAARPWLRPALAKSWPKMKKIAERKMPGG